MNFRNVNVEIEVDKLLEVCNKNIDENEILYNETFDVIPLHSILFSLVFKKR